MSYCATVIYWTSVENSRQKLAVVSDLPRSLVSPTSSFLVWAFFCMEKQYAPTPVLFVWFTWNSCSVCLVYMVQLKLITRLMTKKSKCVEMLK